MRRWMLTVLGGLVPVFVFALCLIACGKTQEDAAGVGEPTVFEAPTMESSAQPGLPGPEPGPPLSGRERRRTDGPGAPILETARGHRVTLTRTGPGREGALRVVLKGEPMSGVRVIASVLDPADEVVGAPLTLAQDGTDPVLTGKLAQLPQARDWGRLRLRLVVERRGVAIERALIALSRFRRSLVVRLLAGETLLAGGRVAVRVVVTRPSDGSAVEGAEVTLRLGKRVLLTASTDAFGTISDTAVLPADARSDSLRVQATHGDAFEELSFPVAVRDGRSLRLTADRTRYQPGDRILARALLVRRPQLAPVQGQTVRFEVSAPDGTVVYRSAVKTGESGVAHAEHHLASEVPLGTYTVRAATDGTALQRTVEISDEPLNPLDVAISTRRPFYLPAATVEGVVVVTTPEALPLSGATVDLRAAIVGRAGSVPLRSASGRAGKDGRWRFTIRLPGELDPAVLGEEGRAVIRMDAVVRHGGGLRKASHEVPMAQQPLRVTLLLPGGRLLGGAANEVLVVVSTPDGRPVSGARVGARFGEDQKDQATTDAHGVATVTVVGEPGRATMVVRVSTSSGETATERMSLPVAPGKAVLLLLDDASYRAGAVLEGTVRASPGIDGLFIDLLRGGQPVLTTRVALREGEGDLAIPIPSDLVGTIRVVAYDIGDDLKMNSDARTILVVPPDELSIAVGPGLKGADRFRPRQRVTLPLVVTDRAGKPVRDAHVDVRITDEPFGAPQLPDPLFFLLEPNRFGAVPESHGSVRGLYTPDSRARRAAARLLSAATSDRSGPAVGMDSRAEHARVVQDAFGARVESAAGALWRGYAQLPSKPRPDGIAKALNDPSGPLTTDPWGTAYRLKVLAQSTTSAPFRVTSAGPDERFGTEDDLVQGGPRAEAGRRRPATTKPDGPAPAVGENRAAVSRALATSGPVRTDADGRATIQLTLGDDVRDWYVRARAVDPRGRMGSGTGVLRAARDVSLKIHAPRFIAQNDEFPVTATVSNHQPPSAGSSSVAVQLTPSGGLALVGSTEPSVVTVGPSTSRVVVFRVRARGVGQQSVTLAAWTPDARVTVQRAIEARPDGHRVSAVSAGRLTLRATATTELPAQAIEGSTELHVLLDPSTSALLSGCLESVPGAEGTLEWVLGRIVPALMLADGPAVEPTLRRIINTGWQRLLTFEAKGGGFSRYAGGRSDPALTGMVVLALTQIARSRPFATAVLTRTMAWLAARQGTDGAWASESDDRAFTLTAVIAEALVAGSQQGAAVSRALDYLERGLPKARDGHGRAAATAALAAARPGLPATRAALDTLVAKQGRAATEAVETIALQTLALARAGRRKAAQVAASRLLGLRDAQGTWSAARPTLLALRALAVLNANAEPRFATVAVLVDGSEVARWKITPSTWKARRRVDLGESVSSGTHEIELAVREGEANFAYLIGSAHSLPVAPDLFVPAAASALSLHVKYSATELRKSEEITVTATVRRNAGPGGRPVVVALSHPPGCEVVGDDLGDAVAAGSVAFVRVRGRHVIAHLPPLPDRGTARIRYRLRAAHPLRAQSGVSRVWEHGASGEPATAPSVLVTVR